MVIAGRAGLRRTKAVGLLRLATCHHEQGRVSDARAAYERAIESFRSVGDARNEALCRLFLAGVVANAGELGQAQVLLGEVSDYLSEQEATGFEALVDVQRAHLELAECRFRGRGARSAHVVERARGVVKLAQTPRRTDDNVVALPLTQTSPEARWMIRNIQEAIEHLAGLQIWSDGSQFRRQSGEIVVVPQGPVLRRLLALLAEGRAGASDLVVDVDTILGRCWPGQRIGHEAAQRRVHESIRRLRRLGLERVVVTTEEGYALDPKVRLSIVKPADAASGPA